MKSKVIAMRAKTLVWAICIAAIGCAYAADETSKTTTKPVKNEAEVKKNADLTAIEKLDQFSVEFVEEDLKRDNSMAKQEELVNLATSTVKLDEPEPKEELEIDTESKATPEVPTTSIALEPSIPAEKAVEVVPVYNEPKETAKAEQVIIQEPESKEELVEAKPVEEVAEAKEEPKPEELVEAKPVEEVAEAKEEPKPEELVEAKPVEEVAKAKEESSELKDVKPEITEAMLYSAELDKLFPLPKKPKAVDLTASNGTYIVNEGIGTDRLARDLMPANAKELGITRSKLLTALFRRNPAAFGERGPLFPYANVKLIVPTAEQMQLEEETTYATYLGTKNAIISSKQLPALNTAENYPQRLASVLQKRKDYLAQQNN